MEEKTNNEHPVDKDILQAREDILRARDIFPSYGQKDREQPAGIAKNKPEKESSEPKSQRGIGEKPTIPAEPVPVVEEISDTKPEEITPAKEHIQQPQKQEEQALPTDENAEAQTEQKSTIPQFNLADQILAEQRKVVSARRKGPGEKAAPSGLQPVVISEENTTKETEQPAQIETVSRIERIPEPDNPTQQWIVADIVTRDIEQFYEQASLAGIN